MSKKLKKRVKNVKWKWGYIRKKRCKRSNKNLLERITKNYDGGNYFLMLCGSKK
jgi:hypothetical protein